MGVGPVALELYHDLARRGLMRPGQRMCEIGSQDLVPEQFKFSKLFEAFGKDSIPAQTVRELMNYFGIGYECIDLDGCHEAHVLDLNYASWKETGLPRYDIVTNHGTTEHIFNQLNCFEFVHDLTDVNGYMIHVLPHWGLYGTLGYSNHGLFLYTRTFFEDLASTNGYKPIKLFTADDRGGSLIVSVLQKSEDAPFKIPMQGVYNHLKEQEGCNAVAD